MAKHPALVSPYFQDLLHRKIPIPNYDTPSVGSQLTVKVQNSPAMWQPARRRTGKLT